MQTICLSIEKGGVGKTTVACHLAWHLAEQGKRILFLDMDQQGNGSEALLKYKAPNDGPDQGSAVAFSDAGGVANLLLPDFALPAGGPAHVLSGGDELHQFTADFNPALIQLSKNFEKLHDAYDFCIIDTAPGWSWINFGALMVTDHVIFPLQLEQFAVDGLQRISDSIRSVEEQGRGGRPINILGIVPNNYRLDNRLHASNLEQLRAELGDFMMPTVPHRQHIAEAMQIGAPVWRLKKDTRDASNHMRQFLTDAVKRIETPPARGEAA